MQLHFRLDICTFRSTSKRILKKVSILILWEKKRLSCVYLYITVSTAASAILLHPWSIHFWSDVSTRIYARPVNRIISGARNAPNGMHFLVHIYNYHGGGFRARCMRPLCAFAASAATSCFLSLPFSFFSCACEEPRDSTRDWQTLRNFTGAPWTARRGRSSGVALLEKAS